MTLEGRTAIVTGGTRGIGLGIVRALALEGANVVVTGRDRDAAEEAAAGLGLGDRVAGFGAHAVDADAAGACVRFTGERFGRVDVLVNNAGTNPAFGRLVDIEHQAFAKTMDLNVWAPILWSRLCWRAGMREYGGVIVNTASIGAYTVGPQLGVYHASKAALVHLTRHLAVELAPRVRVNAIAPGLVRTRLAEALWREHEPELAQGTPLRRLGEPADMAAAVVFLAGDGASWITGETVTIDGGQRLATEGGG